MEKLIKKPKLLLHICCVGCGVYASDVLKEEYDTALYYYNPNIFPEKEYNIRRDEVIRVAENNGLKYIVAGYDHQEWLNRIKGLEKEPEKGRRCYVCYEDRLRQTADYARTNGYDCFTTTLTVSPHKIARWIFELGFKIAEENGLEFLDKDLKKQDGFKKACALSKELNLHRQTYCGCEYSI